MKRPPLYKQWLPYFSINTIILNSVRITIKKLNTVLQYSCYTYSCLPFKTPCVADEMQVTLTYVVPQWMLNYVTGIHALN
jgi:hypothetical protein